MIDRGYIAESQSSSSSSSSSSNQTESNRVERTLPNIVKMEIIPQANEIPASTAPQPHPETKKQLHQLRIQLPALQLTQGTQTSSYQNQTQQQTTLHHPIVIHQQQSSSSTINQHQHHHHQIIQTTNQQQLQQLVQHNLNNAPADQIRSPNSVTVVVIKTMLPDQ